MDYANPDALVSTEWLAQHLDAPDVRVVDATWFLPSQNRNEHEEYEQAHIPGAVFFDINDIADTTLDLPHMMPSPEKFSSKMRKLGLGDGNRIVVYDANGGYCAAARAWWMFRVFGHEDVAVLDGGLPKWEREDRPIEDGKLTVMEKHFTSRHDHTLVRDKRQMLANVESRREQVIDARSPGRFDGTDAEPRTSKHVGHIPGSLNVPVPTLMDKENFFTMRSADELKAVFDKAGVDLNKPIAASCGSCVTACVPVFALYLLGHTDAAVFDGSWVEWGNADDVPIER